MAGRRTASRMGMVLEVVVAGGTWGRWGLGALGPGNWQLAIGDQKGGFSLDWNSRGKQPKTRSSRQGKVNSGGIRRRQAFRRSGELYELN